METIKQRASDSLLHDISTIILSQGVKATTMDSVASRLGISKRTLYEIFESKTDMALQTHKYIERKLSERAMRIMAEAPNVLVGLRNVSYDHVDFIASTDVRFFNDMHDFIVSHDMSVEDRRREHLAALLSLCEAGVAQGVFRPEVDYHLQTDLVQMQMEALKRVEEICGPGRSLPNMLRMICDSFLRAIATRRGLDILDALESDSDSSKNTNTQI